MDLFKQYLNYDFNLDTFQTEAFDHIVNGFNILATAHTGSGKTIIAEMGIYYHLKNNKKIIYTSPIKSLSNEKYKEFGQKFGNYKIGLITGDFKINPDGDIVIMTTEILRILLYNRGTNGDIFYGQYFENLGCVIFDEIHYINNKERGSVWEESLILLDRNIQIIMLSATIKNSVFFAKWISDIKKREVKIVSTNKRVVPLINYIYVNDTLIEIMDEHNIFSDKNFKKASDEYVYYKKENINCSQIAVIKKMISYLNNNNLLPSALFVFSRQRCEKYSLSITESFLKSDEIADVINIFNSQIGKYKDILSSSTYYHIIYRLLLRGICFHHSGIIPILKEIIEYLYGLGYIKILFVTETFAVGINKPIRTVVFIDIQKYSDDTIRYLYSDEYKQIMGRAGRRGIDNKGIVILLPNFAESFFSASELRKMLTGSFSSISSKFNLDYSVVLKLLYNNMNISEFVNTSLYGKENNYESYEEEKNRLGNIIRNIETQINMDQYREYKNLLEISNNFSLTSKQKKKINKMNNQIKLFSDYNKYTKELYCLQNNNYYVDMLNILVSYLVDINYLDSNKMLTLNGIVASHINDCNIFILTEILINKLLNNLAANEIVAIISIFVDHKENDIGKTINDVYINDNIRKCFENIESYVEYLSKNDIIKDHEYWIINYDFVEIAYLWASNYQWNYFKNNIYEGNFVKNIAKINNIISNIIKICEIQNDFTIMSELEKIDGLIIRDIALNISLYV